jgi:hypothetical protein
VQQLVPLGPLGEAQLARACDELLDVGGIADGERGRRRKRQYEKKPCGEPQGFLWSVADC